MFGSAKGRHPVRKWVESKGAHGRGRPARDDRFSDAGVEPNLDELLADPLTQAIMRCDGVSPASLQALVAKVRADLKARDTTDLPFATL